METFSLITIIGLTYLKVKSYRNNEDLRFGYLENINSKKSLNFINNENNKCINNLGNPEDGDLYNQVKEILDSKDKIPNLKKINDYYYNF